MIRARVGILFLVFTLNVGVSAQTKVPNFSGKWAFTSGENPDGVVSMNITHDASTLEVIEVYRPKRKKDDRSLTFNIDGTGEVNPARYDKTTVKSWTSWKGSKLSTSYEAEKQFAVSYERRDDWSLSKDGNTLTITSVFVTRGTRDYGPSSARDRGFNPDALTPRFYQRTSKRVFKKVA